MEKKVYKIDPDKCTKCGGCYNICPQNAIEDDCGNYTIDPKKCEACGVCAEQCPANAIDETVEDVD